MNIVNKVPDELVVLISEYIPRDVLFYTSKNNFENYYLSYRMSNFARDKTNNVIKIENDYFIRKNYYIFLKSREITNNRYINMIIRKDLYYVLSKIMSKKYNHWKKINNYYYNGNKYPNYLVFLEQLCIKYGSNKCRKEINNYCFADTNLRKKRYKKIKTITNRWTN